jgi:D-ribose pyranose/furanose isomerase RbsD
MILSTLPAVAACSLFSLPLAAQDPHAPATATPPNSTFNQIPEPNKRFDLNVAEGTLLADVFKQVAIASGTPINIIYADKEVRKTPVPELSLHQVTVETLIEALAQSCVTPQGITFSLSEISDAVFLAQSSPQHLRAVSAPPVAQALASQSRVAFHRLTSLLADGSLKPEDIITAIRAGWAAASGKEPSAEALTLHKETDLLIASGEPERLAVVADVLKELSVGSQDKAMEELKRANTQLTQQLADATSGIKRAEALQSKIADEHRQQMHEMEAKIRQAKDEALDRVRLLESELAKAKPKF